MNFLTFGDLMFIFGVLVAAACLLGALVEWYETRSAGFALAFIAGALIALLFVWRFQWL